MIFAGWSIDWANLAWWLGMALIAGAVGVVVVFFRRKLGN